MEWRDWLALESHFTERTIDFKHNVARISPTTNSNVPFTALFMSLGYDTDIAEAV